jgi:hypothetical protein
MDAAFMSLERRERGIHALRFGADDARVTKARFLAPVEVPRAHTAERHAD